MLFSLLLVAQNLTPLWNKHVICFLQERVVDNKKEALTARASFLLRFIHFSFFLTGITPAYIW